MKEDTLKSDDDDAVIEKAFRKYQKRLRKSTKARARAEKALKKWYRLKGF